MPNLLQNLEWLNHNSVRNYPLTMDASGQDITGSFTLPRDFLVSLYLAVPTGLTIDPGLFYLRRLDVSGVGFGIVIGYDDGDGGVDVASVSIARAAFERYQVYNIAGLGDFFDITGHVVLGSLESIDNQPVGRFTFAPAAGRLEPDCIRPMLRAVSGIRLQNGADLSELIVGPVTFLAGENVRFTPAGNQITVSAISGENLSEECVCDDDATLGAPIMTINNQGPNADGNFPVQGDECLQIQVTDAGIRLIDACSKPCCGCAELEVITREQERLRELISSVERLATTLEARTQQMDQVVLGSKLSDQPCINCGDQIATTTPVGTTSDSEGVEDCTGTCSYEVIELSPGNLIFALEDSSTCNCNCATNAQLQDVYDINEFPVGPSALLLGGAVCAEVPSVPLPMMAGPSSFRAASYVACPECVRIVIPAMVVGATLTMATEAQLRLVGSVRTGSAIGYSAVSLSGDARTLQFLATNNDVATYTAVGSGTCLEMTYQRSSTVGLREWPETFQLAACE